MQAVFKKTVPLFAVLALVVFYTAYRAQWAAFSLGYPAGQTGFFLQGLLFLCLTAWLLACVAARRWSLPDGRRARFLRGWLPLLGGLLLWMLVSQLTDLFLACGTGAFPPAPAAVLFNCFFSCARLILGIWLVLEVLGRTLWGRPRPGPRTAPRLCLAVLAGTALRFPLDLLSYALAYGQS